MPNKKIKGRIRKVKKAKFIKMCSLRVKLKNLKIVVEEALLNQNL